MPHDVKIGVLALQGAFREHVDAFRRLGCEATEVRLPQDLEGVDAVVMPGGESTTVSKLLATSGLCEPLSDRLHAGLPAFGTCAGMILLANVVEGAIAGQRSFGAIDIAVTRNAFGSQVHSFEHDLEIEGIEGGPFRAIFIRAPSIAHAGSGVELIARVGGQGVAARTGKVLVTAFHPELGRDLRVHEHFLGIVSEA
ncbi:MAG: pyridoxal 5'-phosphate synthase glutaminase subunit PdxT [Acidobacteria bacterium]|nr:MAG: pyridoxal 5'-phosphate synthase glutaminase subunit PdxT [Acidobacteriota bacterium]